MDFIKDIIGLVMANGALLGLAVWIFKKQDERFDRQDARFTKHDERFTKHDEKFESMLLITIEIQKNIATLFERTRSK